MSLCIQHTYSDPVFMLYFLFCYLIWAPQRARTSSDSLVLQMESFCCTCWSTSHPKLTESFCFFSLLRTNVPERMTEWSVSEVILDKSQGWLLVDLLVSICLPPVIQQVSSCCYWQDYVQLCETLQEKRCLGFGFIHALLLDVVMFQAVSQIRCYRMKNASYRKKGET